MLNGFLFRNNLKLNLKCSANHVRKEKDGEEVDADWYNVDIVLRNWTIYVNNSYLGDLRLRQSVDKRSFLPSFAD